MIAENSFEKPAEQETPLFRQMMGRTIYEVVVHFSESSTETMADKVGRLILNDLGRM